MGRWIGGKGKCACGNDCRPKQRTCKECHAKWMRENRKPYRSLTDAQKKKHNARAYFRVYLGRGAVTKPDECEQCGSEDYIEAHHDDYDKPLSVRWLCKPCHLEHHNQK